MVKSYENDNKIKELIVASVADKDGNIAYTFKNGILRYKSKIVVGRNTDLRQEIMKSFHNSELGGHSGERATYQRVKLVFHWPTMKQDVIAFVKACPVCQLNKAEHCPYPGLLEPLPVPDFAWEIGRAHV